MKIPAGSLPAAIVGLATAARVCLIVALVLLIAALLA